MKDRIEAYMGREMDEAGGMKWMDDRGVER